MDECGYKKRTGNGGESATADYLTKCGYSLLARNWHCRCGELDIVAVKGDIIAFVEVKTRKPDTMVSPFAAVNYQKQRKVIMSAQLYLNRYRVNLQPRFDVSAVTVENGEYRVDYMEAAFDSSAAW